MRAAKRIAWNLRRLRVSRQLSQESLAVDANVDVSYVSRLEGASENPTIGLLEKLASALGADICDLLAEPSRGDRKPEPLKSGRRPK
ncbi:helix-turn-helix domain-containing protein [Rhodoplanes azumiensis]|uniref:Helix-turn-helix domain-containing protein n=1 Tax=Rhodoplanes azumiensis TaxID=1897628 RepID=A0ABW5AFM1_9BRAD